MNHSRICKTSLIAIIGLGSLVTLTGCSKEDSGGGASASGGGASASAFPGEGPADSVKAVGAELDKHWLKTPDGWISQYYIRDGMDKQINVFVELKEAKFEVGSKSTSTDAEKQRGVEFGTMASLYFTQFRVFAPTSSSPGGKWSDWREPRNGTDFSVFKQNGTWQVGEWAAFKQGGSFQAGNPGLAGGDAGRDVGIFNGAKPDESAVAKLK